jgi:hypothetical protein
MSDDKTVALFSDVLGEMLVAEKASRDGPRKRDLVLAAMINTGVVKENQREHIGVIIDLIVYCAKNAQELKQLAQASGCLPCRGR